MPSYQLSKLVAILEYTIINNSDLSLNNNQKNISPRASNNGNKKIRFALADNTTNENKDIDQQRPTTPN